VHAAQGLELAHGGRQAVSNLDEPVDGPEPEVEELDPVAAED
jgi:hypothetical protein